MTFIVPVSVNGADTGLALLATIVGTDNKIAPSGRNLTGFFEDGGGAYFLSCTVPTDGQRGRIVVHTGSTTTAIGSTWDGTGTTSILGEVALEPALENSDAKVSSRSTYAGGAVASVTGNVGGNVAGSVASVTSPVTLTSAYDPAKTAAQAGDAMTLASGAVATTTIADGAITSAKFTVGNITSLASATGILERIVAIWRWCFQRKTGPFTSGQVISGDIVYYSDDDATVIGQQAAADDGVGVQTVSGVQDP